MMMAVVVMIIRRLINYSVDGLESFIGVTLLADLKFISWPSTFLCM